MANSSSLSVHENSRAVFSARFFNKYQSTTSNSARTVHRDIEYAFGWNRFNLSLIGLWPDLKCEENLARRLRRLRAPMLSLWVFSFLVAPQIIFASFYNTFSLNETIELLSVTVAFMGIIVRILVLWYNEEVLARCLLFISEDWARKRSTEEQELMLKKARLGKIISVGLNIIAQLCGNAYVILKVSCIFIIKSPLFIITVPLLHLKFDAVNSTELVNQLLYPGSFPFDLRKSSNFAFVYIGQTLGHYIGCMGYPGTDCSVAMLIIHLCGQIAILRQDFINLLDIDNDLTKYGKNLAAIVKRHDTLIELGKLLEETFNSMLLFLVLMYTSQFCLQLYQLMTVLIEHEPGKFPFFDVIWIIIYINTSTINLFLYCYVGDMLIEESEALGFASYSCKWYNLSGKNAKDLMFVMHRAKVPLQISAGKFVTVSLNLFGNVLKTSMSYFSVLLSVKEQTVP